MKELLETFVVAQIADLLILALVFGFFSHLAAAILYWRIHRAVLKKAKLRAHDEGFVAGFEYELRDSILRHEVRTEGRKGEGESRYAEGSLSVIENTGGLHSV